VGFDPSLPLEVEAGATLPLNLTWESLDMFDEDYTVFVNLAEANRHPLAQADGQPVGGDYPTTFWDVGQRVADPHYLVIPSDLEPGTYEFLVGMYLLSTGERLPLLEVDGDVVGDDISLGRVRVKAP
jgi:hypothetical protein